MTGWLLTKYHVLRNTTACSGTTVIYEEKAGRHRHMNCWGTDQVLKVARDSTLLWRGTNWVAHQKGCTVLFNQILVKGDLHIQQLYPFEEALPEERKGDPTAPGPRSTPLLTLQIEGSISRHSWRFRGEGDRGNGDYLKWDHFPSLTFSTCIWY